MKLTRRNLMSGAIALAGGTILPPMVWANTTLDLGGALLDTLSDGHLVLPRAMMLADAPAAEADALLAEFGITGDSMMPDCNLTLWREGGRIVLFDTGSGPDFMPSAGKLAAALEALGLAADAVTDVIFTHAHPDHLWGVLDDFDDLTFPNAAHYIGRVEHDFWTDPTLPDTIGADRVAFAVGAARRLAALADRITLFDDGEMVLPGIIARATHGHTPGHMSFELRRDEAAAMIVGDAIANHHIAFARPDWTNGADQDAALGAATRKALLAELADSQMPMVGFHLPQPGIGRVARNGDAFRYSALT